MRRSLLVMVLALPLAAHADRGRPKSTVPPEQQAQAKKHVSEGTKLFNVQQYDKAAEEYQQAYLIDPQPAYLYASAQALRLGGDCVRAVRAYEAYLRTTPPATEQIKARKNMERCQDVSARPVTDTSVVTQIQQGVEVPKPPPPPEEEKPVPPPPPPPPRAPPNMWPGRLLIGGGVIVAGAGVALFVRERGIIDDNNHAKTYDDYISGRDTSSSAKDLQTYAVYGMAAGSALIVGGILFYALRNADTTETPPPVSATITPGQASVVFSGAF